MSESIYIDDCIVNLADKSPGLHITGNDKLIEAIIIAFIQLIGALTYFIFRRPKRNAVSDAAIYDTNIIVIKENVPNGSK